MSESNLTFSGSLQSTTRKLELDSANDDRPVQRPLCAAGSTGQRNTLILVQRWSVVMKQRRRIYYSAAQRSEIWDRWQAGEPMSSIGRRFDRESSSVFSVIAPTGGIRPPDRHRAKQALSLSEREEISRWLSMRCSLRSIALHLGRSASTISREVQRWRVGPLSGCPVRSGCLGSSATSQALQAGLPSVPEADSINLAAAAMVTAANCRLAQAHISGGISKAGVTRDDLSQPIHSGAWRAEKGAS
jgi:hypothetical protein